MLLFHVRPAIRFGRQITHRCQIKKKICLRYLTEKRIKKILNEPEEKKKFEESMKELLKKKGIKKN